MPIERTLDRRALCASRTYDLIVGIGVLAALTIALNVVPWVAAWPAWIAPVLLAAVAVGTVVEVTVIEPRSYRAFSYSVGMTAIELRSGVLIRSTRCIPYRQVLVVERRAGIVLRRLGLVSVRLKLPEGSVTVAGVTDEAYEEIRNAVARGRADV